MNQTAMDYQAARSAGDRGMRQSFEHAERLDDTFPARADAFIREYARTHFEFTSEQVTAAAERADVKPLSDGRAWGAPIKRAAYAGVMVATGKTAPRLKGHGSPAVVWRSMVFGGVA